VSALGVVARESWRGAYSSSIASSTHHEEHGSSYRTLRGQLGLDSAGSECCGSLLASNRQQKRSHGPACAA
jgi:hypothetical protein